MKVCLIGYGYWGKNLLRNLVELSAGWEVCLAEQNPDKVALARQLYPNVTIYLNAEEAINDKEIAAIVIATETVSHYKLALESLLAGKHVLVEKPLTNSLSDALVLAKVASERDLVLITDHVFLYHPVVRKMKEYFSSGYLGRINYIDATRINLGIYQRDINVMWDLACHDISIVLYLIPEKPIAVRALGRVNPEHGSEDLVYLFLRYSDGLLVQVNASWASPVKMRKIIVGGEKRMLIYDDIEPTEKLKVYEYEHQVVTDEHKSYLTDYRLGNVLIPKYERTEALKNVILEFYDCIRTQKRPLSDSIISVEVIRILESAQESLKQGGIEISLT